MKTFKCDTIQRINTEKMLSAFSSYSDFAQHHINEKIKTVNRLYEEAVNSSGAERHKLKIRIFKLAEEIQEIQKTLSLDLLQEVA